MRRGRDKQVRKIVVDMRNYLFADVIAMAVQQAGSDFKVHKSESPQKTAELCSLASPYALLMEVTRNTPWQLEERMAIRLEVLRQNPHCKIVLVVDENAETEAADKVRQAKKDGLIDRFIYSSTSASFLAALMDTL